MTRQRLRVFAVAAALLIAAGVMLYLKWSSDPAPGEGGGTGNVVGTSGALIVLLLLAGASARRRNKGKGGDRNG